MVKHIELLVECPQCKGTGIYVGLAERNGAGVICGHCHGTGAYMFKHTYTPFTKRRTRRDIKRVYQPHSGYVLTATGKIVNDHMEIDMNTQGVAYADFLTGAMPTHIMDMYCPMKADQSACHNVKGFTDVCNRRNGGWLGYIPACKYKDYRACWQRFEDGGGMCAC